MLPPVLALNGSLRGERTAFHRGVAARQRPARLRSPRLSDAGQRGGRGAAAHGALRAWEEMSQHRADFAAAGPEPAGNNRAGEPRGEEPPQPDRLGLSGPWRVPPARNPGRPCRVSDTGVRIPSARTSGPGVPLHGGRGRSCREVGALRPHQVLSRSRVVSQLIVFFWLLMFADKKNG